MKIQSIIVVPLLSLSVLAQAQTQSGAATDAQQDNPSRSVRMTSVDQPQPAAFTIGWNYYHAAVCQPIHTGTLVTLYVITFEQVTINTNDPSDVAALLPACQSGNLIAVNVTNTSGTWNSLVLFSFK